MSAWKKPSRSAWVRKLRITSHARSAWDRARPRASAAASRIGMPSIHSLVSTRAAVRVQSTCGTRKSVSPRGALSEFGRRRRFHAQIQFQRHRRRQGLDQRDEAQPPRFRREALGQARGKRKRRKIARELRLDAGAQHLDRHAARRIVGGLGLVHLGDGGGRDRRRRNARTAPPPACRSRVRSSARACVGRKWRQPVLQMLQRARDIRADNIGPRRQHLAELDIGGPEALQRARQALARRQSLSCVGRPEHKRANCATAAAHRDIRAGSAHRGAPACARCARAGACREARSSDAPGRMHGGDAAGEIAHLHLRQARPRRSSWRMRPAAESGGCFRRDSDRLPRRRATSSPMLAAAA